MGDYAKTLSVVIPCYNEIENIEDVVAAVKNEVHSALPSYNLEIIIIDNHSTDGTTEKIRELCESNKDVKGILNARNFGQFNSPYYGLLQATGDCAVLFCADFQDPVSMIPKFVHEWENGYKIVCGVKTSSRENKIMRFLRTIYYKLIKRTSDIDQIEHFTGFGLYDREFLESMRSIDDNTPFLRGIVAEIGFDRKEIEYEQQHRRAGKTHNNWYSLYDAAMLSFTSYTKTGLRVATFVGFFMAALSLIAAVVYLILKLTNWDSFPGGTIPILLAVLILGSFQLLFIGLLGEYVMSINARVMKRPLVIEEERINFN